MLADLQKLLAVALYADDPVAAVARAAADPARSDADRAYLRGMSPDGLRTASLLVKKLRFQRIIGGDADAKALFDRDPAGFVELYRAYSAAIDPTAVFPDEEGRHFRAWLASQAGRAPSPAPPGRRG